MSGRPALDVATAPRVLVHDGERAHDVFEVLDISDQLIRVRSPFLFEIGEELRVRIERGGTTTEATVRVRAHAGPPDARLTELERIDPSP